MVSFLHVNNEIRLAIALQDCILEVFISNQNGTRDIMIEAKIIFQFLRTKAGYLARAAVISSRILSYSSFNNHLITELL